MNNHQEISDELLNALADHELTPSDRDRLLANLADNPQQQARYDDICELKKMVLLAYEDIPAAPMERKNATNNHHKQNSFYRHQGYKRYLSAAALLLLGLSIGWVVKPQLQGVPVSFQSYDSISPEIITQKNILLHINSMNREEVELALQTASRLLDMSREKQSDFQVEVIANASGLGVLRKGSPYTEEIARLANENNNIKFMACGIAKQTAMLREKRDISLLPQAREIPAALDRIILRMKDGWAYVQGR